MIELICHPLSFLSAMLFMGFAVWSLWGVIWFVRLVASIFQSEKPLD